MHRHCRQHHQNQNLRLRVSTCTVSLSAPWEMPDRERLFSHGLRPLADREKIPIRTVRKSLTVWAPFQRFSHGPRLFPEDRERLLTVRRCFLTVFDVFSKTVRDYSRSRWCYFLTVFDFLFCTVGNWKKNLCLEQLFYHQNADNLRRIISTADCYYGGLISPDHHAIA